MGDRPAHVSIRAAALRAAALGVLLAGLAVAGRGELAAMPLLRPGRWVGWAVAHGPVLTAFQALRVGAMGGALLWLSALTLVVLARLPGMGRLSARALAPLGRSGMWRIVLGLSVTGATVAGCGPAPDGARDAPPVLTWIGSAGSTVPPAGAVRPSPGATGAATPDRPVPLAASVPGTWVVRPGDDLWSIAGAMVARSLPEGAEASDRRVGSYWVALIDANRPRLPVPSDPNVLYPGDRLVLPALAQP